jgi:hypothetical protein
MGKRRVTLIVAAALALLPTLVFAGGSTPAPTWSTQVTKGRFVVLAAFNNEAVLDKETGLVWQLVAGDTDNNGTVNSSDKLSWFAAHSYCNNVEVGGRKGWRLPSIQEQATLIDTTHSNPALPTGHPFVGVGAGYWSASTLASDPAVGVDMNFIDGNVNGADKSLLGLVWCVRGGSSPDLL